MWHFNQTSSSARTALIYITIGAMTVIWTGVWFLYLHNNPPETNSVYYWCGGFLVTGLTLIGIGFGLGQIGRSATHADLPPQEVTQAVVNTQPTAVAPVPVAPLPNSAPAVLADGPVVVPRPQANQVSGARLAR
jgi:hypothetical protein